MAENVMPHFMADDEEEFFGFRFLDGGVPDDDALGGAEACDVGVDGVGLGAGFHEEHALGRNGNACGAGKFADGLNKLRLRFPERAKFVEERVDIPRGDEPQEERERDGAEPGEEPPASGLRTDQGEQERNDEESQRDAEELCLGPIPEPGAPGLDGLLVENREVMPVEANGKMQQRKEDEENGDEDQGLEGMAAGAGFREVAEFGDESRAKKQEDDREVPKDREKIEAVAGARIGHGFLVFFGR